MSHVQELVCTESGRKDLHVSQPAVDKEMPAVAVALSVDRKQGGTKCADDKHKRSVNTMSTSLSVCVAYNRVIMDSTA